MASPRRNGTRPRSSLAPPRSAVPTVGGEIDAAAAVLGRRGALDTWAALAGTTRGSVWLRRDEPLPDEDFLRRFRQAVARQREGAPLAAAVGLAEFRSLRLHVDRRVLIPRPETEGLVDHVLAWAMSRMGPGPWGTAVDVGTGSGAIALALAQEGRFDRVIATDVSAGALAVARQNRDALALRVPVELRQGSLLERVEAAVQVVVCNLPYLTTGEYHALEPSVRDFEPRQALDGGPDGLEQIRVLLAQSAGVVAHNGLLALEIDSRRPAETLAAARAAGWEGATVMPDVFGRDRYLIAVKERDG